MDKNQSDPSSRAHAKLSASQTKRWMTCPGSMRLIDDMPDLFRPKQSTFAALGTAAHSLVEECLRMGFRDSRIYKGYWIGQDGAIQKQMRDPDAFEVDFDMMDAVDVMLDVVWKEVERLGPQGELRIEHKFDLSWLRPDMFGTNDVSISLFLDELVVIDYKHGQGVPVEVAYFDEKLGKMVGNSQLAYYALGAAHGYDFTHERVTLIVVQPRCPHPQGGVRRFTMSMEELLEFRDRLGAAADVVNTAYTSYDGAVKNGTVPEWEEHFLHPGGHCKSAFCAMQATCPALHRLAEREAMADFSEDPPTELLPVPQGVEAIAQALKWVPVLDARNRAIEALAQRLALSGVEVPGQKVVRKKANRRWTVDAPAVVAALKDLGLSPSDFMSTPELRSPAQVEKLSPDARKLVNGQRVKGEEDWIIPPMAAKGEGALTIAPLSDPREAITVDPSADFPDEDEFPTEE